MKNVPVVGAVLVAILLSACRITPALSELPDELPAGTEAVSYTHLTLPTKRIV